MLKNEELKLDGECKYSVGDKIFLKNKKTDEPEETLEGIVVEIKGEHDLTEDHRLIIELTDGKRVHLLANDRDLSKNPL
ncbi:MAG: hypothetical protein CMI54_05205 [Parcubacteria group bacterium]|nr:hypothetical protein [Parcubacteria group bacterium]